MNSHILDNCSADKPNYFNDIDTLNKVILRSWLAKEVGINWKSLFPERLILYIINYLTLTKTQNKQQFDEFLKYFTFCPKLVNVIPIFMDDHGDEISVRMILDFNVSYDFYLEKEQMTDDVVESIQKIEYMKDIDVNFFYNVSEHEQEMRDAGLIEIKRSELLHDDFKQSEFVDKYHGNSVIILNKNLNEIDRFESRIEFISGDNQHFEERYKKFKVKNMVLFINTDKYEDLNFDGIVGESVYQNYGTSEWSADTAVWDNYGPEGAVLGAGMVLFSDHSLSRNILNVCWGRKGQVYHLAGNVESTDVMEIRIDKTDRSEYNEEISHIDLLFKRKENNMAHQKLRLQSGHLNQYYGIQCSRCGGRCSKGAPIIMVSIKIYKQW